MPEPDPFFQENVKKAFLKIKEDILNIKNELKEYKEVLIKQTQIIEYLIEKSKENKLYLSEKSPNKPLSDESSIGNKGVYADIHSFIHSDIHSLKHINEEKKEKFKGINSQINEIFGKLTKQELMVFLTIYQLEDEHRNVSYIDIAKRLKLSEGCIRTYISNLMKKGAPILKKRHNNKVVYLYIEKAFRELKLKDKLSDLYYQPQDPYQTRLSF